jgi:hypothetical protein
MLDFTQMFRRKKAITAKIRKTTNNTWAIQDAVPAMPPNPNTAATIATTKKIKAHCSMTDLLRSDPQFSTADSLVQFQDHLRVSNVNANLDS